MHAWPRNAEENLFLFSEAFFGRQMHETSRGKHIATSLCGGATLVSLVSMIANIKVQRSEKFI